jgi:hypothetical protein
VLPNLTTLATCNSIIVNQKPYEAVNRAGPSVFEDGGEFDYDRGRNLDLLSYSSNEEQGEVSV